MKDTCPEIARIPLRMIEKNMKRQQLCLFLILKTPGFFSSRSGPLHVVIVVVHDCIMHKFNTEQLYFQFLYKTDIMTRWYHWLTKKKLRTKYIFIYYVLKLWNRKVNDFLNSRNLSLLENWKLKKLDGWADV